jgi:hypothetical protein
MLAVGVVAASASPPTPWFTSQVRPLPAGFAPAAKSRPKVVPREVIVRFKAGAGKTARASVLRSEAATVKKPSLLPNTFLVQAPAGESVQETVEELEQHPEVLYAEPNRLYDLSWDRTTEQKHSGAWSVTDSPGAPYPANDNSTLTRVAPLNLSGQDGCDVNYWLRLETEPGFDVLWLETSPDGVTWTPVAGWSGSTGGQFFELEDRPVG